MGWGQRVNLANTNQVYNTLGRGNGGTGVSVSADDTMLIGNGTVWQAKTIPNCLDTGGQHLNYDQSTNTLSCGTSGGSGGGAVEATFSSSATTVTVTHTLGATVAWGCYIGSAPNYVPMLVDGVQLNSTTSVFTFAAASGAGKCVVSAGGSGGGGGSGTVTSVGLSAPAIFSVSGSPVTTSGTLALALANQSANLIWAGPASGSAAAPTFRSLVALDIPSLDAAIITSGLFPTARIVSGAATPSRCLHLDASGLVTVTGADCNTGGGGGGGITAINSEVGPGITIQSTTTGTDFTVSAASNIISLNMPSAGPAERGLVTAGNQSFAGTKTFLNKAAFYTAPDPGCPAGEWSIYASASLSDQFRTCINGAAGKLGNVWTATGGITGQLPTWAASGKIGDGVAYSQSATPSTIVQRDGSGGLTATIGNFTSQVYANPSVAGIAGVFRRGSSGQTADILQVTDELSTRLAYFDYGGRLIGPVWDKAGAVFNVMAYASGATIGDGTTNAQPSIQAAIDACEATGQGGIVYLPPGIYAITSGTINIGNGNGNTTSTKTPCSLEGAGNGVVGIAASTWVGATVLKYTGSNPGSPAYMVKINGPTIGGGISRLTIDLQSNVTPKANLSGVLIENLSHGRFYDLSIIRYGNTALTMTTRSDSGISYGNCDNKFYGLKIFANAVGGNALNLDGIDTSNGLDSCSNLFQGGTFWHDGSNNTYGVRLGYADNNRFEDTNIYAFAYSTGTVTTNGTTTVAGSGTTWNSGMTGATITINGTDYTFTYVSTISGTLSSSAPAFTGGYSIRHGSSNGIRFVKQTTKSGFPNENHFINVSAHNGVGGTTGTGSPNVFINWNLGDCWINCDPYAALGSSPSTNAPPIVYSTSRGIHGTGAIRQVLPTTGVYSGYWMWGDDVNGTQLYSLKRGAPSANGLEIYAYDDIKFTHPGLTYWNNNTAANSNIYYTLYSSAASADRFGLQLRRARGTEASPSDAVSGDRGGVIGFWWRANSGTFYPSATIGAYADTISGANLTTSIRFGVTNATSFPADKFVMNGDGTFDITGGYKVGGTAGISATFNPGTCTSITVTGGIITGKSGC